MDMSQKEAITDMLQMGRSKAHIERILSWIGHDEDRLRGLVEVLLGTDRKMAEYAAWAVGTLGHKSPKRLVAWYPQLVELLFSNAVHPAVHRNVLRIFVQIAPPQQVLEPLTEACFVFLDDPKRDIAIRAFSIHILAKICKIEPELQDEFRNLLELHTPEASPGLRSIGKKYLKGW